MFKIKFNTLMAIVMMLAFSLFCAGNSYAVQIESMQGKQFVSVYGNINNSSADVDILMTMIGGTFGMFFTDNIEVNGTLVLMSVDADGDEATTYSILGRCNYNFYKSGLTFIPYAGGTLGMTYAEFGPYSDTSLSYGVQGGIKYFMSEETSFNFELGYLHSEIESSDVDSLIFSFGISYYF